MTPLQPQENTVPAPPARKGAGWKLLSLLGAFMAGHVVGFLAAIPCGATFFWHSATACALDLLLLPLSAIIVAALGPLFLVVFGLFACSVQGGTKTANATFLLGVSLLYAVLIWGLRRWWKTESPRARLLGGVVLAGYAALSTFCVTYVSIRV